MSTSVPVTGWPAALNACIVRMSPTTILSKFGAIVIAVPPDPNTVNAIALLQMPFCCTRAIPLTAPAATFADDLRVAPGEHLTSSAA